LHATAANQVLTGAQAGSAANSVGVSGAFNVLDVGSTALAYIEDRANVNVGRDLVLDADNQTLVVNSAGAVSEGQTAGVGASAAYTNIDNTPLAYVGTPGKAAAPSPTGATLGSLSVGGTLPATADATQEVWSVATSGSNVSGSVG